MTDDVTTGAPPGGLERALPWLVAVAATVGLLVPGPGRALADRAGVEVVLALLVLSTGLGLGPEELARARSAVGRIGVVVIAAAVVLPGLAWATSRLAPPGDLRHGVLALGVAPTEIAAVAITSLVGANVAVTAALLVASSLLTVLLAGPFLALVAGEAAAAPAGVLLTLALVVALPLSVGLAARRGRYGPRLERVADPAAVITVSALIWLVASQVDPTADLATVVGAVLVFLAGSTLLGTALARGTPPGLAHAVRLGVSMRDFAVAAGAATAAFGPAAAGPAGVYGIVVLAFGALYPRVTARRGPRA